MKLNPRMGLLGMGCVLLVCATGCPMQQVENEVTWGIKAATGQLTETTPTEWQVVTEKIDAAIPEADITLTDEQAVAIVDFLVENDLNSIDDIAALIERESDPATAEGVVIPDSLQELFDRNGAFADQILALLGQ
jgi:hypothetical protein